MEIYREPRNSDFACRTSYHKQSFHSRFHWHEKIEICQIFSDGCSFYIDGEIVKTSPGDIVVMGEYEIHKFLIDAVGAKIRLCQFPVNILLNSGAVVKPLKKHITNEELSQIPGLSDTINSVFDLMEQESENDQNSDQTYIRHLSASLYFLLMRHFAASTPPSDLKSDRQEFYKITEYINSHYTEDINVENISGKLFIPRGRLSKIFSKFAETDVNTYINSLRVNMVNGLLENGESITDAALASGFQSMRTFNNTYKKIMGITPSEYIKKHL